MPLITFSRIRPAKSLGIKHELPSDTPGTPLSKSVPQSPKGSTRSANQKDSSRWRGEGISSSTSKAKEPRAFTFSFDPFNLFGSFRARPKTEPALSNSGSKDISNCSYSSYSGYVDDDYGEPEAEAEEIRRPSGLGRRASIAEETLNTTDSVGIGHGKGEQVDPDASVEDLPIPKKIEELSRSSQDSDSEELAEIRYPSGLGDIRPLTNVFHVERRQSTYPIFEDQHAIERIRVAASVSESAVRQADTSCSRSAGLSRAVPLLAPYLSRRTLLALNLVDHAVAEPSRRLLWKDITLKVTLSSSGSNGMDVDGPTSMDLLDNISTRRELAHLVKSLELHCHLEASTPGASPRPRTPPLSPSADSPSSSSPYTILSTPSPPAKYHGTPLSLETEVEAAYARATDAVSKSKCKDESFSKLRRPSLSIKAGLPESGRTPVKKRPRSMQMLRPLSIMKMRSTGFMDQGTIPASPPRSPAIKSFQVDTSASSLKLYLPGDSNWTPPPDWEWTPPATARQFPSPTPSSSSSPRLAPSPRADGDAAPERNVVSATPHSMKRRSQSKPSLPSLRMEFSASDLSIPSPVLKASPSLPSFRGLEPPTTPSLIISTTEDHASSPVTTAASPATPYSTVSLSAFPLPPLISTPPSVPPLPLQFLPSEVQETEVDLPSPLSSSTPTPTPQKMDYLQTLVSASTNLSHLTHITLLFVSSRTTASSSNIGLRPGKMDLDGGHLDIDAFESLRDFLLKLESLRSLKVVCAAGQDVALRAKLSVLKDTLKDLEVELVCPY